jgi:hypothetical protein
LFFFFRIEAENSRGGVDRVMEIPTTVNETATHSVIATIKKCFFRKRALITRRADNGVEVVLVSESAQFNTKQSPSVHLLRFPSRLGCVSLLTLFLDTRPVSLALAVLRLYLTHPRVNEKKN